MKSDINVTPLIDVLLVLLIIFLLVAPGASRGLDASLPHRPDAGDSGRAALVLEVGADEYRLDAAPLSTLGEVERRLRAALETRSDRSVFVRAGGDVPYARVVAAVDVAHEAGATRIGLVDSLDPGPPAP